MLSYSNLKTELNIVTDHHLNDGFASLTHFWQNFNQGTDLYYKEPAVKYLAHLLQKDISEDDQLRLPVKFDVPFPPNQHHFFTFIDLFAGIGGIRLGFQNAGGRCVFSSEWNKFARKTYESNFGEVPFGDITRISESSIPDHDILLAGFPCQPFSIAGVSKKNSLGKKHGFADETQGTLFFDILRILACKQPRAFLLENVKNLASHDQGKTFKIIKKSLEEIGYNVHYAVLNAKFFVPQNRERIFIAGFRKDEKQSYDSFHFVSPPFALHKVSSILESSVDSKYTLSDHLWSYLQAYAKKHHAKGNGFGYGLVSRESVTRTLSARYYKDGSEILIPQHKKNPRRLTPRECARLQGFPDSFQIPVSDTQAYKQFGNSVTVPLIEHVANSLVTALSLIRS